MAPQTTIRFRYISSLVFISGLVIGDVFLALFCAGFPLLLYLSAAALGWLAAPRLRRIVSQEDRWSLLVSRGGTLLALISLIGVLVLAIRPMNWETKCAWRYCGRALSPGLLESPYPVGAPTCSGWWTCANEYPFTEAEYRRALLRMEKQGCESP